jgi:hypothetical protein
VEPSDGGDPVVCVAQIGHQLDASPSSYLG